MLLPVILAVSPPSPFSLGQFLLSRSPSPPPLPSFFPPCSSSLSTLPVLAHGLSLINPEIPTLQFSVYNVDKNKRNCCGFSHEIIAICGLAADGYLIQPLPLLHNASHDAFGNQSLVDKNEK